MVVIQLTLTCSLTSKKCLLTFLAAIFLQDVQQLFCVTLPSAVVTRVVSCTCMEDSNWK